MAQVNDMLKIRAATKLTKEVIGLVLAHLRFTALRDHPRKLWLAETCSTGDVDCMRWEGHRVAIQ